MRTGPADQTRPTPPGAASPDPRLAAQSATPVIETFTLGPFATNCYLISAPPASDCWIIDASFEPQAILRRIAAQGLRPQGIILTHAHIDHIAGLGELRAALPGVPVYQHAAEREWLEDPALNLSLAMGEPFAAAPASAFLEHDQELELAGPRWRVLHTPGHSPGGLTLLCPHAGVALVGDTLFAGSVGRFDFPTSSKAHLERSIRDVLYTLPDDTKVYPGHGPPTTIGREKKSNPFVRPAVRT